MIPTYYSPTTDEINQAFQRPVKPSKIREAVSNVLQDVRINGDQAVLKYTEIFDGILLPDLKATAAEIQESRALVSAPLQKAIAKAAENIRKFHEPQLPKFEVVETSPGIRCTQIFRSIEKVGLYIPGGTAPLLSSFLMLAIPAQIAGCKDIVVCSPPNTDGSIDVSIRYIADFLGIDQLYKVGGAQAIGAMAYGTKTIPAVYKIFGPGNSFVTEAKELVQLDGIAIDMPAGPSELMVFADLSANPEFIAADLLSQAEHGTDSQVIFLTDEKELIEKVKSAIERQVSDLPRKEIILKSLQTSALVYSENKETIIEWMNDYAPEHLILACTNPAQMLDKIQNAGSVFLGHLAAEAIGDYAAGPNHTLPTYGNAKAFSGVNVEAFGKRISVQQVSEEGLKSIGETVEILAAAEHLEAHRRAVSIRRSTLNQD